ncbi:MAG TPA: thioesterase domain-containing protein [Enhygromyxa sp.]|nr:thioesterase domain-containing protein [Enhygromyxa sp.]
MRLEDAPESTRAWLACFRPVPEAPIKLLCLHHAGGNPGVFRPWANELPASVEMLAVRLAGRDARLRERPATSVAEIVTPLARALAPLIDGHDLAIFGHSLGALLGFELARELRRQQLPNPKALILSGRNAPGTGRELALHKLGDRELVADVQRIYGGIPKQILDEPDLLALTLPLLRADLTVNETHQLADEPPLACRLRAFGGVDDPHVSLAGLEAWGGHTSASFVCERAAGDHFYLGTPTGRRWILDRIADAVSP